MVAALLVFVLVAGVILAGYAAVGRGSVALARRRLERRLQEVGPAADPSDGSIVKQQSEGPLPSVDRLIRRTGAGSRLVRLIEQAGVSTTPGAVIVISALLAAGAAAATQIFLRVPLTLLITVPIGAAVPTLWLGRRRFHRL